jgi:hypothetical protein
MSTKIQGGSNTSGLANVTSDYALNASLERNAASNPNSVSAVKIYSEIDNGENLNPAGDVILASPEVDSDFRTRTAAETILDVETFNYTAQNTGKHNTATSVFTLAWSAVGLNTNSASSIAVGGSTLSTYQEFPLMGTTNLYCEFTGGLNTAMFANSVVDIGLFRKGGTTPFAPTDGVYFRITSAGVNGVINYNGTEVQSSIFTSYTPAIADKSRWIISINEFTVDFWIDDKLYGRLEKPQASGQPFLSSTLPFSIRHANTGATASAVQFILTDYSVSVGGAVYNRTLGELGNAAYGAYQGLSGGTMGSLASYVNSTNPTAAVPSNTALTANLPSGLGGQGAVTAQAAAATDGIWSSYQVPAGTIAVQGKRLKITGIRIDAVNIGAAVATTATTVQFSLAFGHTAVSLATTEAAATKAPRRLALGYMTWAVGAAIGSQATPISVDFSYGPIYVEPGHFVQLVGKFLVGTATASQVINFVWQPIYSWE